MGELRKCEKMVVGWGRGWVTALEGQQHGRHLRFGRELGLCAGESGSGGDDQSGGDCDGGGRGGGGGEN
jgi:hypothetical protein